MLMKESKLKKDSVELINNKINNSPKKLKIKYQLKILKKLVILKMNN